MTARVTILGCGHSLGTPLIGNHWVDCDPAEPRNNRTRPSIAIEQNGCTLIVDTGPDFRVQINSNSHINKIDAVLYTHYHADHTLGLEDLRGWCRRRNLTLPLYAGAETFQEMRQRYDYLLVTQHDALYPILFHTHELDSTQLYTPINLGGVTVTLFTQDHGTCTSLGVRVGDFAYSTDMKSLDDRAVDALHGIKTWVVDGAAYHDAHNRVHANLETVYALNERVGAEQVFITHLPPTMDYRKLTAELPAGFAPAYDGLLIDVKD